jgi:hypothetical protein
MSTTEKKSCLRCGKSDDPLCEDALCTECLKSLGKRRETVEKLRLKGRVISLEFKCRGCTLCGYGYNSTDLNTCCDSCYGPSWDD